MPELSQETERGRASQLFGWAEVTGPSMVPTLYHGDRLVVRYGGGSGPVTWSCCAIRSSRTCWSSSGPRSGARAAGGCSGDNAFAGGDSTDYGAVPDELVLGRVRFRLPAAEEDQRSPFALARWALSAARPCFADRSASRRLRAR